MPSKSRWTLNPRKWFGTISNSAHKQAKKPQIKNSVGPLPATTQTNRSISIVPRLLTSKNRTKVIPTSSSINDNNYINNTNNFASFTQFQLPPFSVRREKTSTLLNTLLPTRIEPSIRKNSQFKEELAIDTTRWYTETKVYDISKSFITSQYEKNSQENSSEKQTEVNLSNISNQCVIGYPQNLSNNFIEKTPPPTRSHSLSSIDDNDEQDKSSSSGIFTDERADLNDRHCTTSKDTLSTVEALSIESIPDSQISLNHFQSRQVIHPYRLPLSAFQTINTKSSQLQRQTPISRFHRSHSAENILKDNQITSPIITKSRQSSAAIAKKIEKRIPISRSPPITLEKAGFVRISNATYRLTIAKDDHLYHRQRQNSIVQYLNYEDSLPPANNEESYATLPRTSSTEQLNNNLQNDLRAIVDDYLRPTVALINKTTYQSTKNHPRSKRSQNNNNNEQTQINIEDITDKLLSSIDCSTYAQYQRCY
jgi:hypothetical protein